MFSLFPIDTADAVIPLIGQPTSQSSTHVHPTSSSTADRAVDGDTNGDYLQDSCTSTKIGKGVSTFRWSGGLGRPGAGLHGQNVWIKYTAQLKFPNSSFKDPNLIIHSM